jgi:hypothetical protein
MWTGEQKTPPHNAFLIVVMKTSLVTEMNETTQDRINNRTVYERTEVSTTTEIRQMLKIQHKQIVGLRVI